MPEPIRTTAQVIVDTATLIMGDTGTGKTNLLATLFEWLYKTTGKKSLLYSSELGGIGQKMQALIDRGIVWYCRINQRKELPETYSLATQGYWPAKWDVKTGMIAPDVPMIGPTTTAFNMRCPAGHLLKSVEFEVQLAPQMCQVCKAAGKASMFGKGTPGVTVEVTRQLNPVFNDFGAVGFDSISSMQEDILRYQEQHSSTGLHGVFKGRSPVVSGTMTYGNLDKAHYGFAQMRAAEWIRNSIQIPYLVIYPHFTALEQKIEQENVNAGLPIYAPKIAGNARSAELPRMIGNCLGTSWIPKDKEWRLYVTRYAGEDGLPHAVKNRAVSMEAFKEVAPEGYLSDGAGEPYTKFNLGVFYEHLFAALEAEKERVRQEYKDAPGPPAGEISGVAAGEGGGGPMEDAEAATGGGPAVAVGTVPAAPPAPTTAPAVTKPPMTPSSTVGVVKKHLQGQQVMPRPGLPRPGLPQMPQQQPKPVAASPTPAASQGAPPPPKPPAKPPITVKK